MMIPNLCRLSGNMDANERRDLKVGTANQEKHMLFILHERIIYIYILVYLFHLYTITVQTIDHDAE